MKLILFCDYGLDDAAATYDCIARNKEYSAIDIVPIGGNVPKEIAFKNAIKLLAAIPCTVKITLVDTTKEEQQGEFLTEIHGNDGMGDLLPECNRADIPIVRYRDWLCGIGRSRFDLLSLGPMTLVAPLLNCVKPRKFVFMGGNISETPNFHGYEFNHALDREAFSACVKYPHVAITMDTCRNPLLNIQEKGIDGEGLMRDMVRRSRELTFGSGEVGCYIWDDIAVKYLLHPDWFELYEASDRDANVLTVAKYVLPKPYSEIIEQ